MLGKRWMEPGTETAWADPGGFTPTEQAILAGRGVRTAAEAERFLSRLHTGSSDPFLLTDMPAAVERLQAARAGGQTVVVYGDYDADGVSATVLLYEVLSSQGFATRWYIPDRFEEGYGLNAGALSKLRSEGADLLVSVDCGIRSWEAAEVAKQVGLELIITDHHLPADELPPAIAVVNPNRQGDRYPFKGLSGVGVALKLAQALLEASGNQAPVLPLDLVAVGTVSDLAPLQNENRALVASGLEQLNAGVRPGLHALVAQARLTPGRLTANSIGFSLGPRLNAAGRLASAGEAVELLLARPGPEARARAESLDRLNRERQRLTNETLDQARKIVGLSPAGRSLIVAADPSFHEGVVGLVAGRLVDEFYRPALVARVEENSIRGSARSIPQFNITDALDKCGDLLERYGGHAAAAGFGIGAANWDAFVARMERIAEQALGGQDLRPTLSIDAVLSFDQLNDDLMDFVEKLEPCGEGNPAPIFATRGAAVLSQRAVGADRKHLKLALHNGDRAFDAIGFNLGARLPEVSKTVDIAYRLERNEFRGVVSLQLVVVDFRPG
jgi:single-stranded-DNA-specific exonuclease